MVFSDFRNLWKNRPKSGILVRMEATDHRPKFARRRLDVRVCMGLLALLTLAGNFRELRSFGEAHEYLHRTWDGHPFRGTTLLADGPRRVLERHDVPGGIFLLLSNPRQGMLPFERTMHHALSWSQSPRPVRFGSLADVREEDAIVRLFATNSPDFAEAGLDSRGFRLGGSEHGAEVWLSDRVRPRAGAHEARFPAPGMLREALGMLPLLLAIAIGCRIAARYDRMRSSTPAQVKDVLLSAIGGEGVFDRAPVGVVSSREKLEKANAELGEDRALAIEPLLD